MQTSINNHTFNDVYLNGYSDYFENHQRVHLDFRSSNNTLVFNDLALTENVLINNDTHRERQITFDNVDFKAISISRARFNRPITFLNCRFERFLEIQNTPFTSSLTFQDCVFRQGYSFSDCNPTNVSFVNCEVDGVSKFTSGHYNLSLKATNHNSLLSFAGNNRTQINFDDSKINNLEFLGGNYVQTTIRNSSIDSAKWGNGQFTTINFNSVEVNDHLSFTDAEYKDVNIEYLYGPGSLKILTNRIDNLKILLSYFNELFINSNLDRSFSLQQSMIKDILLQEAVLTGDVKFIDVEIPVTGKLSIANSDLGKTNFLKCDFQKCNFEFVNSKVQEIFLSETDFPKRVVGYGSSIINYPQAQFVFGQLQNTYQKQGDNVRSNEYLSREIESHYYTIPWIEKRFFQIFESSFFIPKWFSSKFFTKISLGLNKASTDFGRNWFKGVIFTFGIGLLFFYLLTLSTTEFNFALNFRIRWELIDAFLKFMNPLRHFEVDNIFSNHFSKGITTESSYVWDFFGRVFVTYGYYQTIQAFRRFGKK